MISSLPEGQTVSIYWSAVPKTLPNKQQLLLSSKESSFLAIKRWFYNIITDFNIKLVAFKFSKSYFSVYSLLKYLFSNIFCFIYFINYWLRSFPQTMTTNCSTLLLEILCFLIFLWHFVVTFSWAVILFPSFYIEWCHIKDKMCHVEYAFQTSCIHLSWSFYVILEQKFKICQGS